MSYSLTNGDDKIETEPKASILLSGFNVLSGQSDPRSRHSSDPKKRPKQQRRQRSKPLGHALGPSEDQLSAPYIEEQHPEQPDFIRRPTEDSALLSEEAESSEQPEGEGKFDVLIYYYFYVLIPISINIIFLRILKYKTQLSQTCSESTRYVKS